MKILAKTKRHYDGTEEFNNQLAKPSQVKRLGEYIGVDKRTRFMDVYKTKFFNNVYEVYINIMYQVPLELRREMRKYKVEFQGKEEDIYMQKIYINITTYKQYIRVYFVQLDENEETLGFLRLDQEDLVSLPMCKKKIKDFIIKKIEKKYDAYEVML